MLHLKSLGQHPIIRHICISAVEHGEHVNIHIKGDQKDSQEPRICSCQESLSNELAVYFQEICRFSESFGVWNCNKRFSINIYGMHK